MRWSKVQVIGKYKIWIQKDRTALHKLQLKRKILLAHFTIAVTVKQETQHFDVMQTKQK